MTTLLGPDTFTGTDGSAWSANWALGSNPSGGAAISFVASQQTNFSTSGSSFAFTTPAGASSGNVLVAVFTYNTGLTTDVSNTLPSGWTGADGSGGIADLSTGNGSPHVVVAWKVAVGGTENATWTTASSVPNGIVTVIAYSGVDTTTPWNALAYNVETSGTGSTTHVTSSITPSVAGTWVLGVWNDRSGNGQSAPTGSPTMTVRVADGTITGHVAPDTNIEIGDTNGGTVTSGVAISYTGTTGAATTVQAMFIGALNPQASAGGATIQSNMGRLRTGAHGGYSGLDRISRKANIAAVADTEITLSFQFDTTECYPYVSARSVSGAIDGGTDYSLSLGPGSTVVLSKNVAFVNTVLGTASFTITTGVLYKVRYRVVGTSIQARYWQASAAEPNTWNISVTDSTITAAGFNGFALSGGNAASSSNWFVDDVTITDAAGGGGGGTGPTFVRLPDSSGSFFNTAKFQSMILAIRPEEPVAAAAPTKFGTCFIYHFDSNGVLIDEQVVRFTGDNANPLGSGFLAYPLIQVPCLGVSSVVYLIFDTTGLNELVSITGSYRQIPAPKVFNGGAYFGTSGNGTIGGGGVDGISNWAATVPASTTWTEYPYCWNGPGLLTVEVQGALTTPGADVYLQDAVSGVILTGQRTLTCAAASIFTYPVNIPAGPVKFVIKNNTAGAIPKIVVNLATALSA